MNHIRKNIALMLSAMLMISLAGCGSSEGISEETATQTQLAQDQEAAKDEEQTAATVTEDTTSETEEGEISSTSDSAESDVTSTGSGTLVVYFSRTGEQYTVGVIDKGNTAIVAEMIAEQTGADLFEVLPVDDHYPMTYAELTDVAKQEQNDNARPEYAGEVPDLSAYDTFFIGAPVWWGDWPMIMYTFFEQNADGLSGKKLVPFSTHEGSGLSGFDRKLEEACPNSTILDGLATRGNDCQNKQDSVQSEVSDWLSGLGY